MFRRVRWVVAALCMVLPGYALAQTGSNGPDDDPDVAPGYTNSIFHHESVDSINLYNGQLTIPLAIGPSYPIGPNLRLQVALNYNSRTYEIGKSTGQTYGPLVNDMALGMGWSMTLGAIKPCKHGNTAGNCYIGFDGSEHEFNYASGGYLKSGDGSQLLAHQLTGGKWEMWDGDGNYYYFGSVISGHDDPILTYTHDFGRGRDGAYLTQLKDPFGNHYDVTYRTETAASNTPCWTYGSVSGTCGSVKVVHCTDAGTLSWVPDKVTLPSGATIDFNYDTAQRLITWIDFPTATGSKARWTLGYGTISNTRTCGSGYNISATIVQLTSLLLPSSSGSYTFTYGTGTPFTQPNNYLITMDIPTGAHIEYKYAPYSFFHGRLAHLPAPCGVPPPTNQSILVASGTVLTVGEPLPEEPRAAQCAPSGQQPDDDQFLDSNSGVLARLDSVLGRTDYIQYSFPFGETGTSGSPTNPQTLTVRIEPPNVDGKRRAHGTLFNASPTVTWGVNGTALQGYPGDRVGAPLEERDYPLDQTFPLSINTMPACGTSAICSTNAVRVVRRTFEYSDCDAIITTCNQIGLRRVSKEVFCQGSAAVGPTGACTVTPRTTTYSLTTDCTSHVGTVCNWDTENGRHYNKEQITDGTNTRTSLTTWTPTTPLDTPMARLWKPNMKSKQSLTRTDSTVATDTYFDYQMGGSSSPEADQGNGFLRGTVVRDNAASRERVYCRYPGTLSDSGNVITEFTANIDGIAAPAAPYDFCSSGIYGSIPTNVIGRNSDAFGHQHAYVNGERIKSFWLRSNDAQSANLTIGWNSLDVDRDPETGAVTYSRATDGLQTHYTYDDLGRVITIAPPDSETPTQITYVDPNTTIAKRDGGSPTVQNWRMLKYDGLGRMSTEIEQRAGTIGSSSSSTYAFRTHLYDPDDNETFTSIWTACTDPVSQHPDCFGAAAIGTTKKLYDPLGRVTRILGPSNATYADIDRTDGSSIYSDTSEKTTQCVDGTWNGSACVDILQLGASLLHKSPSTVVKKDLFGRLKSVTEDSTGLAYSTRYAYDTNDKLVCVFQGGSSTPTPACNTANTGGQIRKFVYDAIGYLRSETTPEMGPGTRTYTGVSSLGSPVSITEPDNSFLTQFYEAAGRLQCVHGFQMPVGWNCETGSSAFYLRNYYDYAGTGYSNGLGKLWTIWSRNPKFIPTSQSTAADEDAYEIFDYAGPGGRLSEKSIFTWSGPIYPVTETWLYDQLGQVNSHHHPRQPPTDNSAPPYRNALFQESNLYTYGRLTTIVLTSLDYQAGSFANAEIDATYNLDNTLSSYTPTDGNTFLQTTIDPDPTGMPRPGRIHTTPTGFDSGNYTYDAAGNVSVLKRSSDDSNFDRFYYDGVSRITSAEYDRTAVTGTSGQKQTYTLDSFGNLSAVVGNNARSFGIDAATNRLKSPTVVSYDGRGNVTRFSSTSNNKTWDALERNTRDATGSSYDWQYLYSNGTERLARFNTLYNGNVKRRGMARYLTRARTEVPSQTACDSTHASAFADVYCGDPDWGWIQKIYEDGVTAGCGGSNFCPDTDVTRAQMSVFLWKAKFTGAPPACTGIFADVPCPSGFAVNYIEDLYNRGVVVGCGGTPPNFCPNNPTTELQMAGMMSKPQMWSTFHAITGGATYTARDSNQRVVTEFADSFASRDNVYLGNLLVASYTDLTPSQGPTWTFYSNDHLGSVRYALNDFGQQVESHRYWPFGDHYCSSYPCTPIQVQRLSFAGMELDSENKDYYDHARTHEPWAGRFISVDKLQGDQRNPQSWNRYAYALNNPIKLLDPNGLYTCAIVDLSCIAFEEARQNDLRSKDADVSAAASAYGNLGEENGVRVSFGDPGKDADGITNYGRADWDNASGTEKAPLDVIIRPGLTGTALDAAVGHEGKHVLNAQNFLATIKFVGADFVMDLSKNLTRFSNESSAYRITQSIFASANGTFNMNCGGCKLGPGMNGVAIDRAIQSILASPMYGVTSAKPGVVMFPQFTNQP